jgi:hypothetical protein
VLAFHESSIVPLPAGDAANPVGTVGALAPVPESATVIGEFVSLLVIDTAPDMVDAL